MATDVKLVDHGNENSGTTTQRLALGTANKVDHGFEFYDTTLQTAYIWDAVNSAGAGVALTTSAIATPSSITGTVDPLPVLGVAAVSTGAGGAVSLSGAAGGTATTTTGGAGGTNTVVGGAGGTATTGTAGAGGVVTITGGAGGTASGAAGVGGAAGTVIITAGVGGGASNSAGTSVTAGGVVTITSGAGGASGINSGTAGAAGTTTLRGATGGAATGTGSTGGAGGAVNITGGTGGAGVTTGGAGGIITLTPGAVGAGGTPLLGKILLAGPTASPVTTAQDLTGTDTVTLPTTGIIKRVNPTASRTGGIITVGRHDGEILILMNVATAANAYTWTLNATPATSHCAKATVVLTAGASLALVWDATSSLWYPVALST
jgi:hypothetical protein